MSTSTKKRKPDEPSSARPSDPPQPAAANVETPAGGQAPAPPHASPEVTAARLAAPFVPAEVKFKPQTISGNRALAVPYVDARVIQDRLDEVLGVMGWQDSYEVLADGAVVCRLKVRVDQEWITKEDVGGQSEQPDEGDRRKAAFSDALKRAAVKFGVGRYLYRQKLQWLDWDAQKRQFVRPPVLLGEPQPARAAPPAAHATPAAAQSDFATKLHQHDELLTQQGLCQAGELVKMVALMGRRDGFPASMSDWNEAQIGRAREVATDFVARMKLQVRLDELMKQKGATVAQVLAKLRTPGGVGVAQLSAEQLLKAVQALEEMPDAQGSNGRRAS